MRDAEIHVVCFGIPFFLFFLSILFYGLNGTLIKGGEHSPVYDGIFLIITMFRKLVILRIILRGELLFFRNPE